MLRPPAGDALLDRVIALEVAREYLLRVAAYFIFFRVGRACLVGGERWMSLNDG
jgi:hypothetical protein